MRCNGAVASAPTCMRGSAVTRVARSPRPSMRSGVSAAQQHALLARVWLGCSTGAGPAKGCPSTSTNRSTVPRPSHTTIAYVEHRLQTCCAKRPTLTETPGNLCLKPRDYMMQAAYHPHLHMTAFRVQLQESRHREQQRCRCFSDACDHPDDSASTGLSCTPPQANKHNLSTTFREV